MLDRYNNNNRSQITDIYKLSFAILAESARCKFWELKYILYPLS